MTSSSSAYRSLQGLQVRAAQICDLYLLNGRPVNRCIEEKQQQGTEIAANNGFSTF